MKKYMKPFTVLPVVFLLATLGGLIFFKDEFNKLQHTTSVSEISNSQILANRVQYLDYSDQNVKLSEKFGKTMLFFAATAWCSTCAALDAEIKKRLAELPSNITILKVDYDNDKQTKAKYGVTLQTTLVLLDSNGKEIKRWIGSTFANLIQNLD